STLRWRGFSSDAEGTLAFRAEASGPDEEAESIGIQLAERLLAQGAAAFVEEQTG
ncbi:MAG: hydroxymethylbilane synthase, partial [Chloroflexi bacterium]|nr:hydroxymethylbilane synthase [Chloroflexota bacterium]